MQKIGIIGLGYVGLPLALQMARCGKTVIGIDIDPTKPAILSEGRSYFEHVDTKDLAELLRVGRFHATTSFEVLADCQAIIICVPTPLTKNREPDLSFILTTGNMIAPFLKAGALVVLESTTYPGTTEVELRNVLESGSGLKAGIDFHLAFSPEREDPGNPLSLVSEIPKVVGGLTDLCLEKAISLYSPIVKSVVPVSSCRAAEAAKLLENIFRSVNIALINELKVIYSSMDIDIWEVIEAARTKPFGFMPFFPGPGLGGHCIPIDPFYLTWKAREYGHSTRFIELAGEINASMPSYVIGRVVEALNSQLKSVRGSKILVIGLAYKPDVNDTRESPSFVLMENLINAGATVDFYDPFVPTVPPKRSFPLMIGKESTAWNKEVVSGFDLVLIATAHRCINFSELKEWASLIVDTRNVISDGLPSQLWKA